MHRSHLSSLFAVVAGIPVLFGSAILALLASWPAFLAGIAVALLSVVISAAAMDLLNINVEGEG